MLHQEVVACYFSFFIQGLHASRGDLPGHSHHPAFDFSVGPILKRKEQGRIFEKCRDSLGLTEKEADSPSVT